MSLSLSHSFILLSCYPFSFLAPMTPTTHAYGDEAFLCNLCCRTYDKTLALRACAAWKTNPACSFYMAARCALEPSSGMRIHSVYSDLLRFLSGMSAECMQHLVPCHCPLLPSYHCEEQYADNQSFR